MTGTPPTSGDSPPPIYNGRYELRNQIARGGTAQVYLARDLMLDRPVALKVLFPELSSDSSFVERFRREAQAAANLSHPNIVPVFDWGESDRTYFIVMEHVDGEPLSAIIRSQAPLPALRSAAIAAEIAKALSYAHRHGVVHRDVKPGNVLITRDGQVKVADFGIARAVGADDNVTQTGLVMGTATYFSPEQAQGLGVDGRSDVYSLGVVLYEMVTSRPPFVADTPVAIAYKHVSETPIPPTELEPRVPIALEAVIMRAMAKNPADRYATAEDLHTDLQRFMQGAPVLAPPVSGSQTTVAMAGGASPTALHTGLVGAAGGAGTATMAMVGAGALAGAGLAGAGLAGAAGAGGAGGAGVGPGAAGAGTVALAGGSGGAGAGVAAAGAGSRGRSAQPAMPKRRWIPWTLAGLVFAAALVPLVRYGAHSLGYLGGPGYFYMPSVEGSQLVAVEKTLRNDGLQPVPSGVTNNAVKGQVLNTTPGKGAQVQKGQKVTVVYSVGPGDVAIPYVQGDKESVAEAAISKEGLVPVVKAVSPTPGQATGIVTLESPSAPTAVPKGTKITLTVPTGTAETKVPTGLIGETPSEAEAKIVNAHLQVNPDLQSELSGTVQKGDIAATSPGGGTAEPDGTSVTLYISSGPGVSVPDVVGQSETTAESNITAANLQPRVELQPSSAAQQGNVISENPIQNTQVAPNTVVVLVVGQGPPAGTVTVNNPGPQNSHVGSVVAVQITGSASNGGSISYTATNLPDGLAISSSGLISGKPTAAQTVTVTVTGAAGKATGSTSFTWTVTGGGGPGHTKSGTGGKKGNTTGTSPAAAVRRE